MATEDRIVPHEEWLKADLFIPVLKEKYPSFEKILSFKYIPALKPGENYATLVLRCEIHFLLKGSEKKHVSMIIKVLSPSIARVGKAKDFKNIVNVETGMYLEILPELEDLYKQVGLNVQFADKLYQLNTEHKHILLDNLNMKGFKNINRRRGLDMNHTKHVLKKIAQLHAASAVILKKKGPYPETYSLGYFAPQHRSFLEAYQSEFTTVLVSCLAKLPNSYKYLREVRNFIPKSVSKMCDEIIIDENEFLVLNHGDLWSNNIMFKHDRTGNVEDVILIDHQVPVLSSPAHDLLYLILSSTQANIKIKFFDYFIKYYHDCLIENLKLLNYPEKLPTLKDLQVAIIKRGAWAYNCCTTALGVVLAIPSEKAKLGNFIGNTEEGIAFKAGIFSSKLYMRHAEIIFPWLLNRGAFEI